MSPHGTAASYNNGCRCEDCKEANYQQHHAWMVRTGRYTGKRPHMMGRAVRVAVDSEALRRVIASDGRPLSRLECDAGLSCGALHRIFERGRCTAATFDAVCAALDLHGYEIEVVA